MIGRKGLFFGCTPDFLLKSRRDRPRDIRCRDFMFFLHKNIVGVSGHNNNKEGYYAHVRLRRL